MSGMLKEPMRKKLRGRGHSLKPVVMIGNAGLTEAVMKEVEAALLVHELIKVKIRTGDRAARDAAIKSMCDTTEAQLVQRVGNTALLYRPNPD